MEKKKEGANAPRQTKIQLPIFDRILSEEVEKEVTLPDYQPEIRRLLRVGTTLSPVEHYVGGGGVEYSGNVDLCVVYVGNDGETYCHPVTMEYRYRVPLEAGGDFDLNDGLVVYAENEPDSTVSRVLGPRRLSLRCKIRSHARAFGSCVVEEKQSGAPAAVQRLEKEREVCQVYAVRSAPRTLTEEILLERQEGLTYRILNGEANLQIGEVSCTGGKVNCRGNLHLSVLLGREGETPKAGGLGAEPVSAFSVNRKIPFSAEVETDGAVANGEAVARGYCTELRLSLEEGRMLCEAEVVVETRTQQNKPLSYTADWFAVDRESSASCTVCDLPRSVACVNGQFSQNGSLSTEEAGIPAEALNGAQPLEISGRAYPETVGTERGKLCVTGKCRYTVLFAKENEVNSREIELPFRYTTDVSVAFDSPLYWDGGVQLLTARVRMDGERIAVDGEIGVNLRTWTVLPTAIVTETTVGDPIPSEKGETVLFYPVPGETLWQVAKAYATPIETLLAQNVLPGKADTDTPASLEGVKFLTVKA